MPNPMPTQSALDLASRKGEYARVYLAKLAIDAGMTRPEYQCMPGDVDRAIAVARRAFDLAYAQGISAAHHNDTQPRGWGGCGHKES